MRSKLLQLRYRYFGIIDYGKQLRASISPVLQDWLDENNITHQIVVEYHAAYDDYCCGIKFKNLEDMVAFKMQFDECLIES